MRKQKITKIIVAMLAGALTLTSGLADSVQALEIIDMNVDAENLGDGLPAGFSFDASSGTMTVSCEQAGGTYLWEYDSTDPNSNGIQPSAVKKGIVTSSVRSLEGTFNGCTQMTSIELDEGLQSIGGYSFCGASITEITIPQSVTEIVRSAFSGCDSLATVVVKSGNSKYYSTDSEGKECNVIVERDKNTLLYGCKRATIPDTVTTIGKGAFYYLLGDMIIPNSVTTIGENAFANSPNVNSISIPDTVTTIGKNAFKGCQIKNITIPSSVNNMGTDIFLNCNKLATVINNSSCEITLPTGDWYSDSNYQTPITNGKVANGTAYKKTSGGQSGGQGGDPNQDPDPIDVTSGDGWSIDVSSKTMTITENIITSSWGGEHANDVEHVIFTGNVTRAGGNPYFNKDLIKSVTLNNGVTSIAQSAFENFQNLTSVSLPEGLLSIEKYAF